MNEETWKRIIKNVRVPYCYSCFDKGYNSYLANEHSAEDILMGEYGGDKIKNYKRYCGCKGGEKLRRKELTTK